MDLSFDTEYQHTNSCLNLNGIYMLRLVDFLSRIV